MTEVDLIFGDGFSRKYVGPKGVLLRKNHDHIQRCIRAIRQRFDNEVEITIVLELNNPIVKGSELWHNANVSKESNDVSNRPNNERRVVALSSRRKNA